ncbi:UNVERIFIED_CONTAM: hypothetical protein Slati_1151100 [Sesamum latifolium]|uniref:Uncharacterized protein n=1 Tax=Sesamum latifolium TaxID=2727402 RepID=A0AAW2XDN4_9LAMI
MASMIGAPLQIDDATSNQSKLSKARAELYQISKDERYHTELTIDYVATLDSTFAFENGASKFKDHVVVHETMSQENDVSVDVDNNACDK